LMSWGCVKPSRSPKEQEAGQQQHTDTGRLAHGAARKGILA
jgi:hypothetical protein